MTTSAQKIRNVSLTESQSVRICKTSTNAFLSSIAYFRKIFPENRFRDVYWADGVQFPTLNYDRKEENNGTGWGQDPIEGETVQVIYGKSVVGTILSSVCLYGVCWGFNVFSYRVPWTEEKFGN